MADTELKPCPFCGGKADIIVREHDPYCPDFGRTVKINCRCGICTHTSVYQDESDLKEVIEYWNKRTAADVQPVKWISVNDRLPENGDMVMCYCKTTTGEGNVHMFGCYLKEHWWLKTDRVHATLEMPQMKVMYWLPLPEPPKEG